ncbi:MAG: AMP-binding protein [Anaerolineales bacterium]|jgi:long-chain acyl-CoA synthetase
MRPKRTPAECSSIEVLDTLPKQFLEKVKRYGDKRVAVRQKELGIWQEFTWQDSYEQVRDLCLGLVSMGLQRGDRVCIVGDNDRQHMWADLAIMSAGGSTVGIFTDAIPSEMEYVVTHSESIFVFAKDQEQCDKFLEIRKIIPLVKAVIYWDPRGMWSYRHPWLISYEEVQRRGRELRQEQPDLFEKLVAEGKGSDLCNLCYTSGTTGMPKGAMLSHLNFLEGVKAHSQIEPRYETDNQVSITPLAWIAEHTLSVTPHCMFGLVVNFPESPETVQQNIREIAPDLLFFPARLWENLTAIIQMRINDGTWINRTLYKLFLPIGYKVADLRYEGKSVGPVLAFLYWLGDLLVFRPIRNQFGFVRVRTAITAGAALSPDVMRYFRALGVNLMQVFSSTETAAVGTQHYEGEVKYASVGKPAPGVRVRISEDGEILFGGPNVFHGYFKNPEETSKSLSIDEEGIRWFHTGDACYIDDDGHVIYLDRLTDMIELASGERFSPQFIEGRLKFSPYIRDVMAVGSSSLYYVTALISIDFGNVGRWAEKNRIPYTTFVDLSQKHEVCALIMEAIEYVNETLPPGARVRKFVLLHKEFDADEAEMTRTRKLRRTFLADRYREMIEAMYSDKDEVHVSAAVKYRDGREGVVETTVRVETLEMPEAEA